MEISPFITAWIPYWTAFLAGLFGGVHCVGMCGGVAGMLSFGAPKTARANARGLLPYLLAYNLGRIGTYVLLGGLMGYLGALGGDAAAQYGAWRALRILAGVLMMAMGLYLAGWWMGLTRIERLGGRLWALLAPVRRRVFPVRGIRGAVGLGLVWGFLPCGLVYTLLIWALAAGGIVEGAMFLFSFGLGTLPVLLLMGLGAGALVKRLQGWRGAAGLLVMGFGVWTLYSAFVHTPQAGLGCIPAGYTRHE